VAAAGGHAAEAARVVATLRERKKLRTRDALAAAALRLSAERGFESVTIDEIAAAADVSRRTFFRYFPTKEAALFPDYARRLARFRAELAAAPPGEAPFATVERAFTAIAAVYVQERDEIVAQQRVVDASPALIAYERTLDRDWERAVAAALEPRTGGAGAAGGAVAGRHARVLAGATMGAVRATLREWLDAHGRPDLRALARDTFAQLAGAVEPPRRSPRPAATRGRP
jgi:AcrR family transcriptional regulator